VRAVFDSDESPAKSLRRYPAIWRCFMLPVRAIWPRTFSPSRSVPTASQRGTRPVPIARRGEARRRAHCLPRTRHEISACGRMKRGNRNENPRQAFNMFLRRNIYSCFLRGKHVSPTSFHRCASVLVSLAALVAFGKPVAQHDRIGVVAAKADHRRGGAWLARLA
jgi:hypothetical protein